MWKQRKQRPNSIEFAHVYFAQFAVLDGLKYASSHEWVKHEGSVATIGITDHAQVGWLVGFVTYTSPP